MRTDRIPSTVEIFQGEIIAFEQLDLIANRGEKIVSGGFGLKDEDRRDEAENK